MSMQNKGGVANFSVTMFLSYFFCRVTNFVMTFLLPFPKEADYGYRRTHQTEDRVAAYG